jgi:hypothetical protein
MALEHLTNEQIRVCVIALRGRRTDVSDELVDELQRRQEIWLSQDQAREREDALARSLPPQGWTVTSE